MNVACIICRDQIFASSEIYTTQCGHLFHYNCLDQWMKRSKTCPQCRNKTTEKTIHRIYFNVANIDHIVDDVGTLQSKLDSLSYELRMRDKDIAISKEKNDKIIGQNAGLRKEVADLEGRMRTHESAVLGLKDRITFYKSRVKECDRYLHENEELKNKLRNVGLVQLAIEGSREDVNQMLKEQHNVDSLVILVATLKKALIDAESKKSNSDYKLKKVLNEVTQYRREVSTLEASNKELKRELESSKINWGREKEHLKNKIQQLLSNQGDSDQPNTSIKRIISESPIPLPKKRLLDSGSGVIDHANSPAIPERVTQILQSDSPYLPVKMNSVDAILSRKFVRSADPNKVSIFKGSHQIELPAVPKISDVVYNGLGGHSREDIFPSPRPRHSGTKRHKPSSSISSSKFRKLTSGAVAKPH